MKIGVVKEIKPSEYRVAITPMGVAELVNEGHEVLIEQKAGEGSYFEDQDYREVGATIKETAQEVWTQADLIYKVKEIFPEEYKYLRDDLIVMTYIHSNAHRDQTQALLDSQCKSVAYEDVSDDRGEWPLLSPMSELAGKGGFLAALHFSQTIQGGRGQLLANVCGVRTPVVTIIGGGHTGKGAAELAAAFGNKVNILDLDYDLMVDMKTYMPPNVNFLMSNRQNLLECLKDTDVLINCVLWPKHRTDHLVHREDLKKMRKGAMIIDVACDEGGAIETCRATTHTDPVYYEEGILHYCVDNIPSAFAHSASITLSNATLPFVKAIANKGFEEALREDKHLRRGLTTYKGQLTLLETAKKLDLPFTSPEEALGMN
ncbi:MAG: alanine dehydrogenase [Tissierellia bacterium]|nr:alanine dehydrogenase [Tissierellia bacterium]